MTVVVAVAVVAVVVVLMCEERMWPLCQGTRLWLESVDPILKQRRGHMRRTILPDNNIKLITY